MKKIKVIISGLAALLAIAYLVCSLLIPAETIAFMNNVGVILNYPITIAGVSMTIGGIIAYVLVNFVIKNTKFGRKEIDNVKTDNAQFKEYVEGCLDDQKAKINEIEQIVEQSKRDNDNQVTILYEEFKDLQNNLISSLKVIPNKKVQAIVKDYEDKFVAREQEIIEKTVHTNSYVDKMINQLNEDVKKFMAEIEEKLNEREETTNIETETA